MSRPPASLDGAAASGQRELTPPGATRRPFWRRRGVQLAGAILVIVAIAVVVDIPQKATPAAKRADAAATIHEIAGDVAQCNAALRDAFTVERGEVAGTLTNEQRGLAHGILADDANACSYTNQGIDDLGSLDLPQVSIGKDLNHVAQRALDWADPDGLTAIDDVATLLDHPHDIRAAASLRREIARLRADRAGALADEHVLARTLGAPLPSLGLRVIHP